MPRRCSLQPFRQVACLLIGFAISLATLLPAGVADAQVQQGATLTILRGQVAIIRANGTAIQPAPNGSTVDVGDEIRTISKSGALITFYSGTEIEMSDDTVLVVDQLSRQGDKIDVSLRQVLGATVNRVQTIAGTGSTYQVQAGGAVALVRGTAFAMVGPVTTSSGNVVIVACLADCSPASTFAGCAMQPFMGYGVVVAKGKLESGCMPFAVARSETMLSAAFGAVTTVEQQVQGDTHGVPAGQVTAGSRQEIDARLDQQQREDQEKDGQKDPPQSPSTTVHPPGARPCNTVTQSGGGIGTDTKVFDLGRNSGTFTLRYQAYSIADQFQVIYQGATLLNTGEVSGTAIIPLTYSGTSPVVTVIVTGDNADTEWNYTVGCPT